MSRWLVLLVATLALLGSACVGATSDPSVTEPASAIANAAPPAPATEPTPEPTAAPTDEQTAEPTAEPTAWPTTEPTAVAEDPAEEPAAASTYDAPGDLVLPLPLDAGASPGSIIDTEALTIAGAIGKRILYYSTSANGEPVAVSGFVSYPDGDVPEGGWPLIAWAHGTTGLADSCAPSITAETDQLMQGLVGFGYAVVATDYEGLGTPGTHPYVVGASEAHGVLDSVRAVHELDLPVTDQWVVFGHSQGGHAAMFTGQLQPTYAPELELIGVVAGAPPSQLAQLNNALIGGDFQGYLIMTAAGLVAADDALRLEDVLSARAIELSDVVETGCTAEIFDVFNPLDYADVTIVDDPFALPDWAAALQANDTNQLPVEAPLLIIHGGADEQIPVETSTTLFDQLCAFADQGPTVRNVYEGQTHAGVLSTFAAVPDLLAWVGARFAGETAPDACPA